MLKDDEESGRLKTLLYNFENNREEIISRHTMF